MSNRRTNAQVPRKPSIVESVIEQLSLVKHGLILGIVGIVLAVFGEAISSEGTMLFAMHVFVKYFGVSLFITGGVLLLVEKLPETIEMRHLEEEMELHGSAIARKNDDGRSNVIQEGSALAFESLQKLFPDDIAKAIRDLLGIYSSIPVQHDAQRRIVAWLLKNELLTHISNIALFASESEAPSFDVRYLQSGPYFTAAMLTAHMKLLENGDSYFSAGEIWFYLDAEAIKDFMAETRSACERGVHVRRVFDLNSPSPFNLRKSSEEELATKIEVVLEQHRRLARDSHGMYEFVVLNKSEGGHASVQRYAVFSKHSEPHQLVFRPQNRELGTFTLEYVQNAEDALGTELLWKRAWNSQSTKTRLVASLRRGYAWCRRRFVAIRGRAFSILAIALGLVFVYWGQLSSHHGPALENIEQHAAPEWLPHSAVLQAIYNAVPAIVPDLKYDAGIALAISGIAAMLIAPRRRRLQRATERASHEFLQFEERREAAVAARKRKARLPTSREGISDLLEKAVAMCVDDAECAGTFVNLVRELDHLSNGQSPDQDALVGTAKWVMTKHLKKLFDSVKTFGDGSVKRRGNYAFSPPSDLAVMEQLFGELIAHSHPNDSLDSLIDFEYFIPPDAERFEMKKLREALAAGFKVRRIFHCTYHKHAQPAKSQVTKSDIERINHTHKELQQQYPNYQLRYLTAEVISRHQSKAFEIYGIENLNQYLHAALKLHNPTDAHSATRVYYLNIKYASDEKQLSLEKTDSRDKRITFFDKVWDESEKKLKV
jgi:hypothetical protein